MPIKLACVRTVMVFAADPESHAAWWAEQTGAPLNREVDDRGTVYPWAKVAGIELGFHPADPDRNPAGGSPVVYFQLTGDLDSGRDALLKAGCIHHRGPLQAEPGRRIAQLTDPFGFVFGIEGS